MTEPRSPWISQNQAIGPQLCYLTPKLLTCIDAVSRPVSAVTPVSTTVLPIMGAIQ